MVKKATKNPLHNLVQEETNATAQDQYLQTQGWYAGAT